MKKRDFKNWSPLRIFLSYFGNHKGLFIVDLLCACAIAGVDLLFPLATRHALYELLPGNMYRPFFFIMIAVLCFYLLRSFLNYIVAYFGHTFGIRVEADKRSDLFRHMQALSFDFFNFFEVFIKL